MTAGHKIGISVPVKEETWRREAKQAAWIREQERMLEDKIAARRQ